MGRITDKHKITEFFASNVFNKEVMKKYLSEENYLELNEVIEHNKILSPELADVVAIAMKDWASANGATHYTHWFQPLTGSTAEKHESFISVDKKGNTVLEFTGKNLSKGETDASSFPSGGIRATFEARGYTIWDSSSPAFLKKTPGGALVLYIPTAFCSYNGEALDQKTPLLRSMEALNKSCLRLLSLLNIESTRVNSNVGAEQEYFLIDKEDFIKRDDLRFCRRTLFGNIPAKGQEQDMQYYGSIRDRVSSFMADVNEELWRMGITAKTEHNEVAPCQHELVPIFTTSNIAADQNQLIMETLKNIASEHDLVCLLHEKPFDGINGSGKHNNWSINTVEGINLLKPGKEPMNNLVFLLLISAVIGAVDEYNDLIRMSAATPENDCRLGGNEAPPSIISIFIGDDLENMLEDIEKGVGLRERKREYMHTGVNYLADFSKDTSDRNRTSPFAFTGNKFEFRMVGSSSSLALPTTVLNTITSEYVSRICDEMEKFSDKNLSMKEVVYKIVKKLYSKHKRIIYKGNNYSKEWQKEAKKRGIEDIDNAVDAYETLIKEKNIALFEKNGVLNKKELESRREIYLEHYVKVIGTEIRTMLSMIERQLLPAGISYQDDLARTIVNVSKVNRDYSKVSRDLLDKISTIIDDITNAKAELERAYNMSEKILDTKKRAIVSRDQLKNKMAELRKHCDLLELYVPKDKWPIPTYSEILYYN